MFAVANMVHVQVTTRFAPPARWTHMAASPTISQGYLVAGSRINRSVVWWSRFRCFGSTTLPLRNPLCFSQRVHFLQESTKCHRKQCFIRLGRIAPPCEYIPEL